MSRGVLNSRMREFNAGRTLFFSLALHAVLFALLIAQSMWSGNTESIRIGGGPGGDRPGERIYAVGLADDLGGGSGMFKPSPIRQAPVLKDNPSKSKYPTKFPKLPRELDIAGVALPELTRKKNRFRSDKFKASKPKPKVAGNTIPVPSGPGAGGAGATAGGAGGAGQGVSIGSGTGGIGNSWYARAVERRISENWLRSLMGPNLKKRVQAIVSFTILSTGTIQDVRMDKSSGDATVDMSATRAVQAANPLPPVPPEYRGQKIRILAYFEYPPNP